MAEPRPLRLTTRRWVRAIVDFAGIAGLLIGFLFTGDLVKATWWLVAGSAGGLAIGWIAERRIAPIPLVSGGAALVFGALTLAFHDIRFVKMKPTFMNIAFAVFLLAGAMMRRNPLKLLLGEAVDLTDAAWRTLTIRYGVFFVAIAALNEVVWRTQPDRIWVFFRFPGLMILTVLFSLTQAPLILRHARTDEAGPPADDAAP